MIEGNIKIAIISAIVVIGLGVGTHFGINAYRKNKCKEAIQNTTIAMQSLEGDIRVSYDVINKTQFILVTGEKEKLEIDVRKSEDKVGPIKHDIVNAIQLADVQQVRALLEPGFTKNYVTPIDKINAVKSEIERVVGFCNNRKELRNRSLDNELLLKATLKKPIDDAIELPSDLMGMPVKYLSIIPRKNSSHAVQLPTLAPVLNNSLGVKLLVALPTVETIKNVAKTETIRQNAQNMWNNAREAFANVKPQNDAIHWYIPKEDDGSYNSDDYAKLLSQQKASLDSIARGNTYLDCLTAYCEEVKNQYVVYVSNNPYESTSFSHSRKVRVTKTRRNSKGERETYTDYETEYYHTPGRIFYYTKTTISNTGAANENIRVGSKDSHGIFGFGWEHWDYNIDQRQGYLIEYKEFGLDNTGIIRGGSYNPVVHMIKGK